MFKDRLKMISQGFKVRGALTAEAAIVVPIFLLSVISLIRLIFLVVFAMRVQMYSDKSLEEYYFLDHAVNKEAIVAQTPSEIAIRGMLLMHLGEESVVGQHLFLSILGLDVSFEEKEDPNLVVMDVTYSPAILRIPGYTLRKKVSTRVVSSKWEGRAYASKPQEDTRYCYITPRGEDYHLSTECPYLDLSVKMVSVSGIGGCRNSSGHIYKKCSVCNDCSSVCYYTEHGEYYHSSPGCNALKRTINRVPLSECSGYRPCPKCVSSLKEEGI